MSGCTWLAPEASSSLWYRDITAQPDMMQCCMIQGPQLQKAQQLILVLARPSEFDRTMLQIDNPVYERIMELHA
jgi:hypothetical protein